VAKRSSVAIPQIAVPQSIAGEYLESPGMRSPAARGAIALAAVAAVVVLFVVLGGDDDGGGEQAATTPTQTQPATGATGATSENQEQTRPRPAAQRIVVQGGRPRGGVQRLEYDRGDRIQFVVRSDVADEVHVHGYDISKDVPAGGSVRFSFPARIEGVFEVELEGRHEQIAELRVSPG
jgi:hypothetical protein